jgi:hypothetical protein
MSLCQKLSSAVIHPHFLRGYMRLDAFIKRWVRPIAFVASACCTIGTADASCHVWNGCMGRVAKHLAEFRELGKTWVDLSQKCIDALNGERSIVALQYSVCIDAESYGKRVQNLLDDEDVRDQLTADDKTLRDGVVKNGYTIVSLANEYKTPAEREAARETAEDARADEARSAERRAAIVGALAAGAQGMANQQAARPPNYTCFTQPGPGGATTTCLTH